MRAFLSFVTVLVVSSQSVCGQGTGSWSSYYNGKRYDFNITHAQLKDAPSWPREAENPPLSVRKAIAIAQSQLPKMISNAKQWRFGKLSLTPVGDNEKWVYVVEFFGPHPPGVLDGPVPSMRVVVLMSGVPVQPVISEWKS